MSREKKRKEERDNEGAQTNAVARFLVMGRGRRCGCLRWFLGLAGRARHWLRRIAKEVCPFPFLFCTVLTGEAWNSIQQVAPSGLLNDGRGSVVVYQKMQRPLHGVGPEKG